MRELVGLVGIAISVYVTFRYHDYFVHGYMSRVSSEVISDILSTFTVFAMVTITLMIINSWVMHMLSFLRFSSIDRFAGLVVGCARGICFSYLFFFVLSMFYYTLPSGMDVESGDSYEHYNVELPNWIKSSYSYPYLHYIDNNLDTYIPQSFYNSIRKFSDDMKSALLNEEKSATPVGAEESEDSDKAPEGASGPGSGSGEEASSSEGSSGSGKVPDGSVTR